MLAKLGQIEPKGLNFGRPIFDRLVGERAAGAMLFLCWEGQDCFFIF